MGPARLNYCFRDRDADLPALRLQGQFPIEWQSPSPTLSQEKTATATVLRPASQQAVSVPASVGAECFPP
jgi:hypothetical protein